MKQWLVKIRRYDGSESVVDSYDHRDDADNEARYLNEAYQADTHYVEEFDTKKIRGVGCMSDNIQTVRLDHLLGVYRVGSSDWSWQDEYDILYESDYQRQLTDQIRENGITEPIMLGNDGRVWDGHHRVCAAMHIGIDSIPVEWAHADTPVVDEDDIRLAVHRGLAPVWGVIFPALGGTQERYDRMLNDVAITVTEALRSKG